MTAYDINPASRLQISTTVADGVPTLRLDGELDQWTTKSVQWSTAVDDAFAGADSAIVLLDLRRLYFMDLDGLASLTQLENMLEAKGQGLLIAGVRPRIREFLRNNDFFRLATELGSFEDALAQAAGSRASLPEAAAPATSALAAAA